VALGAGLAAAAGLFLFFVATGLFKQSPTAPSAQGSAVRGLPPVIQRGVSYSPASLRSLAAQLRGAATRHQRVTSPVAGAFGPAETTPAISAAPRVTDRAAVASCLRSAAGVDPSLEPFYLEAAAFQGTPAFIGAFVVAPAATGGQSHLLLVASSESGCQPLYVVRQSL